MGIAIDVEGLSKSFRSQRIFEDVSLTLPEGEVSVLLGPSGTGKSVFLKCLIGLLKPERGKIVVNGVNIVECSARELNEIRTLFGVMFQDGALFGSMNLYDNTAFPLREHTKKKESEIRDIVMEKLALVGLAGDEKKYPGEISGGMKSVPGWPARWCSTRRSSSATSPTPVWTRYAPPIFPSCSSTSTPKWTARS